VVLEPFHTCSEIGDRIVFQTSATSLIYVGDNLTIKTLNQASIPVSQLPALVYGLSQRDLLATEIWNMILEHDIGTEGST